MFQLGMVLDFASLKANLMLICFNWHDTENLFLLLTASLETMHDYLKIYLDVHEDLKQCRESEALS